MATLDTPPSSNRPHAALVNDSYMTRESWKLFQVIAELVEGFERLVSIRPSVSIFGSARIQPENPFYALTEEIALLLSNSGFAVVTGGGPGLMEAANKGAMQGKSLSIGLNIDLLKQEPPNAYQDIALKFRHFFTRKIMFVKYATAYVVMPGGYGTLDEFAEILTLIQTGKTRKIPVVLVHKEFWSGLIHWFENTLLKENLIKSEDLQLFHIVETPEEALQAIQDFYKERNIDLHAHDPHHHE